MSHKLNIPNRRKRPSRIKWFEENYERIAEKAAAWREKNKEKYRNYMREYSRKNRDRINQNQRKCRRLRIYGLTEEKYNELLIRQKHACAICGKGKKKYDLAVDHDHKTGKIRGVLCSPCNRALGILGDSLESLKRAVDYLESKL